MTRNPILDAMKAAQRAVDKAYTLAFHAHLVDLEDIGWMVGAVHWAEDADWSNLRFTTYGVQKIGLLDRSTKLDRIAAHWRSQANDALAYEATIAAEGLREAHEALLAGAR